MSTAMEYLNAEMVMGPQNIYINDNENVTTCETIYQLLNSDF